MHSSLLIQSMCYYLKRCACSECNINIKESNDIEFKSTFSLVKRFEPRQSQRKPYKTFKLHIFSTYRARYTALWPWCVCKGYNAILRAEDRTVLTPPPDPIRKDRHW